MTSEDSMKSKGNLNDNDIDNIVNNRIITYANGDKYEGEIKDDKLNGYGIMKYANGDRYEG